MTAGAALLASEASFNRYIVECKLISFIPPLMLKIVLIDT